MRERKRLALDVANHAKTRAAQRGINAENHFVRRHRSQCGLKDWRDATRRGAGDAVLHLLELLERNAHTRDGVRHARFSKAKTPARSGREIEGERCFQNSVGLPVATTALVRVRVVAPRFRPALRLRRGRGL